MNQFIFDPEGNLNCFYYGTDESIYQRIFKNGKWGRAVCVISEVRGHYSVMCDNGLSLLCQEYSGDMVLCQKAEGGWKNSVILESKGISPPDMRMQRIGEAVLYNLPEGREQTLVLQRREEGKWQRSEPIDSFAPFANGIYRLIELPDKRKVLIYRKNLPKQRLYFRISNDGGFGDYKTVYSANSVITDCSAVFYDGFLHFVLAVRGRFACSLIYVRAAEQAAERHSTVLWEGSGIDAAAVRAEKDGIIVSLGAGRRIYTFISTDSGFKGLDIKHISAGMKKAYVTGCASCCEMIVPADKPYDIDTAILLK